MLPLTHMVSKMDRKRGSRIGTGEGPDDSFT